MKGPYRWLSEICFFGELVLKGYDTEPGKYGIDVLYKVNSLGDAIIGTFHRKERKLFIQRSDFTTPQDVEDLRNELRAIARKYSIQTEDNKKENEAGPNAKVH